eukprot:114092_1
MSAPLSPPTILIKKISNTELLILELWCRKHNFDDEFFEELVQNCEVEGLNNLQSVNRMGLKQIIKKLNWDKFKSPSNEDELLTALDLVDAESPSTYYGRMQSMQFGTGLMLSMANSGFNPPPGGFGGGGRGGPQKRSKKKAMKSMNIKRRIVSSIAAAPPMQSMQMNQMSMEEMKMDFGDDDMMLGFAVGGAKDIQLFRDQIENNKMPRKLNITHEGIYNDYYFDTSTKQKGQQIDDDNKDTEQPSDNDEKPMFYPSYCYAKCRAPYALLMAKKVKPKIDKDD